MLQRSQSRGLCCCLSQWEQLRSVSLSVPTSNRGKKQKITPEQFKLFEFAFMHTGDDNREQNLLINYNNILLQGFVNLVQNW